MAETASLTIKVDSSGARRATDDLDKLGRQSGKAERATDRLTRAWQGARRALGALGIAHIATASGVMALVTSTSKAIEQTGLMAQQIGTTTESLSEMRYAAQQMANVSEGQFDMALRRMTRRITEAAAGGGPAADAIKRLGLEATALARLAPDEQFKRVADAMRAMDDQGERLRATMALMDTEGMPLVNMLSEGAEGIEQFTAKAREMGLTISTDTVAAAQEFNRKLADVKSTMRGVWLEASGELIPTMTELAELLQSEGFKDGFKAIVDGATSATTALANLVIKIGELGQLAKSQNEQSIEFLRKQLEGYNREIEAIENNALGAAGIRSFLGFDNQKLIDSLREQMAPIEAELQKRLVAQGVDFGVDFIRDPAPARASSVVTETNLRTEATKELTQAERDFLQLMEEVEAHEEYSIESERARRNERYTLMNREQDARERAMQRVDAMIEQLQFEHSLIGMTSVEREKAIALRYADAAATDEQRRAIEEWIEKIEGARTARDDMDYLRDGAKDLFSTVVTDSARASDALDRFFDNLKRKASERLFEALLGGFSGMAGGGGWAGFAGGFMDALRGNKAAGGPLQAGSAYVVGDGGRPEVFVPGQSGRLHPVGSPAVARGGDVKVEVINNGAPMRAKATTSQMPDGSQIVRLVLDAVAEDVAMGGRVAAAGKARFGWREQV